MAAFFYKSVSLKKNCMEFFDYQLQTELFLNLKKVTFLWHKLVVDFTISLAIYIQNENLVQINLLTDTSSVAKVYICTYHYSLVTVENKFAKLIL